MTGLVSAVHRGDMSKPSQWERKYGKQYPAFNGKRNIPSFLAMHDYPAYDPASKRSRFKSKDEMLSEVPAKEVNQSKVVEEQIGLVTDRQPAIVFAQSTTTCSSSSWRNFSRPWRTGTSVPNVKPNFGFFNRLKSVDFGIPNWRAASRIGVPSMVLGANSTIEHLPAVSAG